MMYAAEYVSAVFESVYVVFPVLSSSSSADCTGILFVYVVPSIVAVTIT